MQVSDPRRTVFHHDAATGDLVSHEGTLSLPNLAIVSYDDDDVGVLVFDTGPLWRLTVPVPRVFLRMSNVGIVLGSHVTEGRGRTVGSNDFDFRLGAFVCKLESVGE